MLSSLVAHDCVLITSLVETLSLCMIMAG